MAISRIIVRVAGRTIADTTAVLILRAADIKAVHYVPRRDAHMGALTRPDSATYCPYKGEASCFSIPEGGARSVDAVWTYEKPHPGMEGIAGYLAFYRYWIDPAG